MPPKKVQNEPKKAKPSVADKTFGMKNKKIQQIAASTASAKGPEAKRKEAEKLAREKEKAAAEQAARETAELFKPVQVQKVPFGVDPKTILCQFYKKGHCDKGRKCKFSHDLNVERKQEKKNLYTDTREDEDEEEEKRKKEGGMEDWDEEKLRQVVMSKHGNPKTTTDKVCKFFIEAVENGFVLKTKEQRAAEKALMDKSPLATLTLEDFLESERHKLTGTLTPVTPETFAKWKKERLDKKAAEAQAQAMKEATGRALFEKGDWKDDSDDESGDDEDDDLQRLRAQTEREREEKELERIGALG
ncbi:related to TMA46-Protein putative involved in cytoplasmic ribosome function [Ramularia collo-cygni]|uniref:Related to TMA46-Protein putative involved in cytoplasmic ribosome function n=1 Tax=Ramularia collo-cygni TaxID=112498 RepID=A0A2D3VKZ2_9PEZI|nr:related to TMA46-Protein putative involved in cytoplasmic ribosome function [Ramularia collo-cygni]CZT24179.1 related to TMA46-Protein putative involved in cytoplasmic ribosome function [Ramularia collo-cygni]